MRTNMHVVLVAVVCVTVGLSSLSFGEDTSQSMTDQMSPELRKNMADMYQKMGDCLRTGKSNQDCQRQIAKDCPVIAKTGQCPIEKGMGNMGPGGMSPGGMGPMGGSHDMR
ncbi:MAG: hypothetical protein ABI955_07050 [Nitrospirota bacterium]